jgi:hypothetical protein
LRLSEASSVSEREDDGLVGVVRGDIIGESSGDEGGDDDGEAEVDRERDGNGERDDGDGECTLTAEGIRRLRGPRGRLRV